MRRPSLADLSALAGAAAWLAAALGLRPGLAEALLLLGPLVVVPLGLALAAPSGGPPAGRWRLVAVLQLPAALPLVAAFQLPPGAEAAALSLPWLLFTACVALLGALRLAEQGPRPPAELAVSAGLLFLVVGGAWLLISRWGRGFLGFGEPIVLLTAAHFHFAGFALPILAGLAGRAAPGRAASWASWGVVTGVPLVALGIALTPRGVAGFEPLASGWLAAAGFAVAGLYLRLAHRHRYRPLALLALVAGSSLLAGMGLAATYALGIALRRPWLGIPAMVESHAVLNAIGFALPALLYWRLAGAQPAADGFQLLLPWLGDRPDLPSWERRPFAPETLVGPRPDDARDCHRRAVAIEPPGPPAPSGPFRHLHQAILRAEIFPPRLLAPVVRRTPVEVGDTMLTRYRLAPGLEVAFASRVTATFDGEDGGRSRGGFTYRTLAGHPFAGEESFAVEQDLGTGEVRVVITSWSRPASPLVRLLHPWIRRRQLAAGAAATDNLRRQSSPSPLPG